MSQTINQRSTNWKLARQRFGPKSIISPPMADTPRTEEDRQRVQGWEPIVRVLSDRRLRVALVGRMSSGKSSLFNALVTDPQNGRRVSQLALRDKGLTRDCVEGYTSLLTDPPMHLTVIDTPGMMRGGLVEEARRTLATADVVLMICGVDEDITDEEYHLAETLMRLTVPALLVVNKMDLVEEKMEDAVIEEYGQIGLGRALPLSVRAQTGIEGLALALEPLYRIHEIRAVRRDWALEDAAMEGDLSAMEDIRDRNNGDRFIRVAIVGRANSGKSSLLNRLVGFERSRASAEAQTTRDPVEVECVYRGRKLRLVDTAGMSRRRARRDNEFRTVLHHLSLNVIRVAHVVIVVFDATEGHPSKYDMRLLHVILEEGRPFIMCANKWDAVLDASAVAEAIDFKIKRQMREVKYGSAVACSAHTGLNLTLLMDEVLSRYDTWNKRIRNAELNRFWRKLERSVIIPSHVSRIGRLRQVNTRPPTFLLQLQSREASSRYPASMRSMVKNAIAEEFDLKGVPIRILQETKDNHPDYI